MLRFLDDAGYALGMIRDTPSWLIPNGGTYDQLNLLNDRPGICRMRMGSTALVSGAQTAFNTVNGFVYSQDTANTTEELYGVDGKTGTVYLISKTAGTTTNLGTTAALVGTVGRPVRHFGFGVFPINNATRIGPILAGQTTTTTFITTTTANMAAGNPQITLTGADVTTNIKVGAIVQTNGISPNLYKGRVVSIDTTKLFTVWPVPTVTVAYAGGDISTGPQINNNSGSCGASFQNRLLYGNSVDLAANTAGKTAINDRNVIYSPLPTEQGATVGAFTLYGATFLQAAYWPSLNYFTVPGSDPIIALEPLSDNALLILTGNQPVILDGTLATQLATTSPTITFDESTIMQPAGCLSDLSVQRTPRGIVWAGTGGIYAYNGGRTIDDLTAKRINSYWRGLTTDATFVLHGSFYARNHYIVSGTSGGGTFSLACNMDNLQWTRLSGVGTDIFLGVARPTNQAQVFVSRWWDQSGAAPSFTNGQTLRIESMFAPYVTGATTTDADGTAITMSLTTRPMGGDTETQKLAQRVTERYQQSSTTAAVAVTGQAKIDAADISAASVRALGSLSNTSVLTITAATNATPIVVTTSANHGLQDDDFVDIDGITGNTNANGRWRIDVLSNTTFHLVGSTGNGVTAGSPTCKKVTESGFLASPLNAGQAFSFKYDGAPNNFEHHGVRLAILEKQPVMSA